MAYTVNELSKLSGVSVRTLHYYDEIGLLKPARVGENGYRFYEEAEVARLHQILFFRELEFPLERIKQIMSAPGFDSMVALEDQRELMVLRRQRLDKLLATIEQTIDSMKGGEMTMSNDDKFSVFNDPTYREHKAEAEQRWGNTEAYKQSQARVAKMSKADFEAVKAEGGDIWHQIAELMKQDLSADSDEVQAQVDRFWQHLHHFYDPSYEMFKGLGQMYVDDPRFTEFYDKIAPGMAVFARDAMAFYADSRSE